MQLQYQIKIPSLWQNKVLIYQRPIRTGHWHPIAVGELGVYTNQGPSDSSETS